MSETRGAPVKVIVAIVALFAAGVIAAIQLRSPRMGPPTRAYYYDLGSGDVFVGPAGDLPIVAPSGDKGVRAHVVSCGACEPGQWTVLSIRSYSPEAQRMLSNPPPPETDDPANAQWNRVVSEGQLIAPPPEPGQEPQWIGHADYTSPDFQHPAAETLRRRAENLCGGKPLNTCMP